MTPTRASLQVALPAAAVESGPSGASFEDVAQVTHRKVAP